MPRLALRACASTLLAIVIGGCASGPVEDPMTTLSSSSLMGSKHKEAIALLAQRPADDEEVNKALERVIGNAGYTPPVREEALNVLAERDLARAKRVLRLTLPNSTAWEWLERAGVIIADRNWLDLTPALVSSWARPASQYDDDLQRPEYLSLVRMHGEDRVIDVVFETFRTAKGAGDQGLRARCWELLYRLGERERLVAMISSSEIAEDDAFLLDLQAAARDLGLVPHNREEILWLRKLRQPEHAGFWSQARDATAQMSPERRAELNIRDLPVVVSAYLHDPPMLTQSKDELYARVEDWVRQQKHHTQQSNFDSFGGSDSERLYTHRERLTWGDLAAMLIAIRAMQVPQVVTHLFDYAARDRTDETTELGGVVRLDSQNRFELLEFQPLIRGDDQKFIASQAMLDAAYTAIFHFHFHVQYERNERFAGPGYGDANYADNTRANCLVLTSVGAHTMNVDFYRHDRVVVDLGDIKPGATAAAQR